jgi:aminopeptidase N
MSCTSTKPAVSSVNPAEEEVETRDLDTLVVSEPAVEKNTNEKFPKPVYRASQTRIIDLIHTKLALSFDYEKEHVLGEAWIDFTPVFDPVQSFALDAQYFDIHSIQDENGREIPFTYVDSISIRINWPEVINRLDTVQVYIDYTAVPGRKPAGGSQAISSNKGLFFINPQGTIPNKPTQIWTQGETEHNSNWFPTLDQPNARCSQEVILNVPIAYETLSNGKLLRSEVINDSIRQDHWLQELPHAPYLFMLAIGDFAVVRDQWEDIPLAYYVEHDYKEDAPQIFNHTPEMLAVFSEMLDYRYPWAKYDQVVVRDYVSGAMENTTGVIFGDFVQKHQLDLVGNDNDFIVAHEMFHHWFGDLVTCESWSNLTMNEGFATYSEYLWKEYKFGKDEADLHRANQLSGYLAQARQNKRPIIDFEWVRPENMFDAHSYNKGGLVLHMLRDYLGSEKFFAGLNLYLERHAYSAVEAHDLRLAMEDVSGEDLNWFFNQWFYDAGHPQILIQTQYEDGTFTITAEQTQDPEKEPAIFILPTYVDIYMPDGERQRVPFQINQRVSVKSIPLDEAPALTIFDPRDILLAEVSEVKTPAAYALQFDLSPTLKHRLQALKQIPSGPLKEEMVEKGLSDAHWSIRKEAISVLPASTARAKQDELMTMARSDSNILVRAQALKKLMSTSTSEDKNKMVSLCQDRIEAMEGAIEMSTALEEWYDIDSAGAIQKAQSLESVRSEILDNKIAALYAKTGNPDFITFLDQLLPKQSGFSSFPFFNAYSEMTAQLRGKELMDRVDALAKIGLNQNSGRFTRYGATKAISDIKKELSKASDIEATTLDAIKQTLEQIISQETSTRLKAMYSNF